MYTIIGCPVDIFLHLKYRDLQLQIHHRPLGSFSGYVLLLWSVSSVVLQSSSLRGLIDWSLFVASSMFSSTLTNFPALALEMHPPQHDAATTIDFYVCHRINSDLLKCPCRR
ncbi:hypothetical protein ILYODFUR_004645 [Ilyodon furcidens]|uniref:Uncharacterized protein n=1 Tax=Ilyodon furcidens TaxID=33524 RepID=A0ABV0TRW5_9TELE